MSTAIDTTATRGQRFAAIATARGLAVIDVRENSIIVDFHSTHSRFGECSDRVICRSIRDINDLTV